MSSSDYFLSPLLYKCFRRSHVLDLLDALKRVYGPGYDFAVEKITEGGIQFTNWPGKSHHAQYKSVRFPFYHTWPEINDSDDDRVLFSSRQKLMRCKDIYDRPVALHLIYKVHGKDTYWTFSDTQRVALAVKTVSCFIPPRSLPAQSSYCT